MSDVLLQINGCDVWVSADDPRVPKPEATDPSSPQTVFTPADVIATLLTPAERIAFASKPEGVVFIALLDAEPSVDVASALFAASMAQAVQGGFLTQARADQVLAGTPAPQGA